MVKFLCSLLSQGLASVELLKIILFILIRHPLLSMANVKKEDYEMITIKQQAG